jgi:lysophospholipase L1-like esterase
MRFFVIPAAVGLCLLLGGCSTVGAAGTPPPTTTPRSTIAAAPTTIAVVGDSLTAGGSLDFSGGEYDRSTWVTQVLDDDIVLSGGWAIGGATTASMRAAVEPVDPDVLVIMAGTNDIGTGVPFQASKDNMDAIVRIVGGSHVIISAIPPYNPSPAAADDYNTNMAVYASSMGWTWVDPTADLRSGSVYKDGMSVDGVHPTAEGQTAMAEVLKNAIEDAASPFSK